MAAGFRTPTPISRIETEYDPKNLSRVNRNIPPASS